MAQGILERLLEEKGLKRQVVVDSAGTHVNRKGLPPDRRAQQVAGLYGIDLVSIRTRKVRISVFQKFDSILVMDYENICSLQEVCPREHREKLSLLMEYAPGTQELEIPDPYFGSITGFERVFKMLDTAMRGFVEQIYANHSQ